ncbi:Elongation factor Ts, mitochondrial [Thelohanellus kitauei]|uniref:Elongation factor Ts, mitochondrial n=1 Tax=Thelohanellus kitauei TaxID=669202 RepID=A0A0C2N626_THEKT|nr:Elongation factor Ts, mitochondrial [Thelohanellus kitauei]
MTWFTKTWLCSILRCSSLTNKELLLNLRRDTGAPFSICKEALLFAQNDIKKARGYICDKFNHKSSKLSQKAGPLTNGLIGVGYNDHSCALVKINCESDFVAKTQEFLVLTGKALECCLSIHDDNGKVQRFKKSVYYEHPRILEILQEFHFEEHLKEASGKFGEKLEFGCVCIMHFTDQYIPGIYAHSSEGFINLRSPYPNHFGRIGSMALLRQASSQQHLDLAHDIARQITGNDPYVNATCDEEAIQTLLQQEFLSDPTRTVSDVVIKYDAEIVSLCRDQHSS